MNINRIDPTIDPAVTVKADPPDSIAGGANIVNVYCYHLHRSPHQTFQPSQTSGSNRMASSQLTLVLHYIVTAHNAGGGEFATLSEQRLLGFAAKTIHENAQISDSTKIGDEHVLPPSLLGKQNKFEIAMVQLNAEESLSYWANSDSVTAKPSLYYEVRAVELEPNKPKRTSGVVLNLGAFVTLKNTPSIGATLSTWHYVTPESLGSEPMAVEVSPAKVGPISADLTVPNELSLKGSSFNKGARQKVSLSHSHWGVMFPAVPRIKVDLAVNSALGWQQSVSASEVRLRVGDRIRFTDDEGVVRTISLYPGGYTITWHTTEFFQQEDGTTKEISQRSNDAYFTVYPRIVSHTRNGTNGVVSLSFGGTWLLNRGRPPSAEPLVNPPLEITVSVDGEVYEYEDLAAPSGTGKFVIGDHDLTYRPEASANVPGSHSVQVIVNGVETQPFWVNIP